MKNIGQRDKKSLPVNNIILFSQKRHVMKILDGGLENIPGYSFNAIKCGIKYDDRLDYCIIYSENPCHCGGLFTTNKICAAPVTLCRQRINNPIHGVVVNATNANACTGDEGMSNAVALTDDIAQKLNISPESILMSSTGVIGHQLPLEKMLNSHEELLSKLTSKEGELIPQAIMTTDTFPKSIALSFNTSQGEYFVGGTAKGSGMIAPDMATMLSYILTDAPIEKETLQRIFKDGVNHTFNSITIDGDTSTNDTALILCPISQEPLTTKDDLKAFEDALKHVLISLAEMLVKDGEGATKLLRITVQNALTTDDAQKGAASIANSLLVKTAFFGKDPNWGRIAMAIGKSGAQVKEDKLDIFIGSYHLLDKGKPTLIDLSTLDNYLSQDDISVTVDLHLGTESWTYLSSDLTYEYVKINAEYTT